MARVVTLAGVFVVLGSVGCTIDVPFPPSGLEEFFGRQQSGVERWFRDPFDSRPYPVLVGGDSERVYYATSLTDIRLNFRGRTNDLVLPSFVGPSNLYEYKDGRRALLRALIPAGAFWGMTTDGTYVAYVRIGQLEDFPNYSVVVSEVAAGAERVVFDPAAEGPELSITGRPVALADGRVALVLFSTASQTDRIRVEDLTGQQPRREIESEAIGSIALHGGWLAYAEVAAGQSRVVLRDLVTDQVVVVAADARSEYPATVQLTDNTVVWMEAGQSGIGRVLAYDIPTATTRVWADAATGELAGATDTYFLTEEFVYNERTDVERIVIRRYDGTGQAEKLAEFRADGLAGQSRILGDRAAWVTADRRVILAPLAGGPRTSFRPY